MGDLTPTSALIAVAAFLGAYLGKRLTLAELRGAIREELAPVARRVRGLEKFIGLSPVKEGADS